MKRPIVITLLVIALAFVCLGIGAVIFFTANGGFPTNNPFDRRNISSELEESKTLKVDTEKPLTLKVADCCRRCHHHRCRCGHCAGQGSQDCL